MSFFEIVPNNPHYLKYNVKPIALKVISDNGVDYSPDIDIVVNDLNRGKKYFLNNSGSGDTFKISVIIKSDDTIYGKKVVGTGKKRHYKKGNIKITTLLDYWIRNMIVMSVKTEAIDINNGAYVITGNSSRKQTMPDYTVWDLEFTKYSKISHVKYKYKNTNADKIAKQYERVKTNTRLNNRLKKCDYRQMKYKKHSTCIYYLNYKLYFKGFIKPAEWKKMVRAGEKKTYTKTTIIGLKRFKLHYNKKILASYAKKPGDYKSAPTVKNGKLLRTNGVLQKLAYEALLRS